MNEFQLKMAGCNLVRIEQDATLVRTEMITSRIHGLREEWAHRNERNRRAKRTPTHRKSCMSRFWHTFLPLFSRDVAIYPDFSFFSIIFIRCCNLSKIPFIFSPQGRIDVFYGNSTAFCSWARLWSSLPEPTRLSAHFVLLANPLSRRSHPVEVESLNFQLWDFQGRNLVFMTPEKSVLVCGVFS